MFTRTFSEPNFGTSLPDLLPCVRLCSRGVVRLLGDRAAEEERLDAFANAQAGVCDALGIARSEWLFLATRLQRKWEQEDGAGAAATASAE